MTETSVFDTNGHMLYIGDTVKLFDFDGIIVFEAGAFGIGLCNIDWDFIESKIPEITGCNNTPYFCHNDNFISFWELLWNFNCEDNCCSVVTKIIDPNREEMINTLVINHMESREILEEMDNDTLLKLMLYYHET